MKCWRKIAAVMAPPARPPAFFTSATSDGFHRAQNAPCAGHVELHPLHSIGWLDRDSSRIEAEALPNECNRSVVGLAAGILKNDQLGVLRRSLRNAEERSHPFLLHLGS